MALRRAPAPLRQAPVDIIPLAQEREESGHTRLLFGVQIARWHGVGTCAALMTVLRKGAMAWYRCRAEMPQASCRRCVWLIRSVLRSW